jgi:acyl-coenzyme A thioesterase PaaI-like protein
MLSHEQIQQARDDRDLNRLIAEVPYAQLIGMHSINLGKELIFVLPALESNIGNPTLPAIHGGVIGGFMENAAIFHTLGTVVTNEIPRVVDFSLDYLRPGRFQETYCSCEVVRQGRKVVNVSVSAWQNTRDEPIANARTHLLL